MTIDIAKAKALVETLKDYAERPSSFTDISPTEADAAADTISALLEERDALMSLIRDEIDENTRLRVLGGAAADEGITAFLERVIAERDALARDAARWRALLELDSPTVCECEENGDWVPVHPQNIEKVVDAAMKGASDE